MQTNTAIRCRLLLILLLSTGLGACNKLLEVPPPPNEVSMDHAFNDSASAVAVIAGIYNRMVSHGHFEWSGISFYTARSADDALTRIPGFIDNFAHDSLLYTSDEVLNMWEEGFNSLLTINTCIRGYQSANGLSPALQRQLLGESFFCRAFVNFYLVNIWGDAIPLITTPDMNVNQFAKSVPRQQVYDLIMADLLQAQALLTNAYAGEGRVRPNVMAATALLARVYLYQKRYSDAIAQATTVIGSNLYRPLPPPDSAFLQSGKEAIWQLMLTNNNPYLTSVGDAQIYLSSYSSLTTHLVAAFEPGDLRRQSWVIDIKNNIYGFTVTTANKYKERNVSAFTEYNTVLRLAEQYLIRAEAYTRLGQTEAAIADLNVVRARAGLPALPASLTQQQCMSAVEQERRVEFFTEWGHRWFDLKRWPGINNPNVTRADEVLGAIKPDWQLTDQWYPVPRSELQLNTFLVQNPGYPVR